MKLQKNHDFYLYDAAKKVGGYPLILKAPIGSFGDGVMLVESERAFQSLYKIICKAYDSEQIIIQEFLEDKVGIDHRGFVVGDKVVAAMERVSHHKDFRSNLDKGGKATAIELDKEQTRICIEATKALGLDIAAVDLLYCKKRGWLVTEVNASPGLEGITDATGIDVAGKIIDYIEEISSK